jgi:hypothetical protein
MLPFARSNVKASFYILQSGIWWINFLHIVYVRSSKEVWSTAFCFSQVRWIFVYRKYSCRMYNELQVYVCMYVIYILPLWFSNKVVFVLIFLSKTILFFYAPEIMMQVWRFSQRYWWRFSSMPGYNAVLTGKQLLAYQDMLLHLFSESNQYSNTFHGPVSAYIRRFSNVLLLLGHADMWTIWSNQWFGIYLGWSKLKVCSQILKISFEQS